MPAAIPLVIGYAASAAAVGLGATAFAATMIGAAAAFAAAAIMAHGARSGSDSQFTADARGRQVMIRSAVEPRRILYGEVVVSGPLVFASVSRQYSNRDVEEPYVVPAELQVSVRNAGQWSSNRRVFYVIQHITGDAYTEEYQDLTQVSGAPAAGEYSVANGVYTFHASAQGTLVTIGYSYKQNVLQSDLHLVIALAGHEVQEIGDVYLGLDAIASSDLDAGGNAIAGKYAGFVRVKKYLGSASQTADADLIAETAGAWTADHRGHGVAYIYVRLRRNENLFPAGVPNIRARVKGAKVYDPRSFTVAWSNNWALCVRDYLTRNEGLGCDSSEINDTLVSAAANVSDEQVALDATPTYQDRYTCDGSVSLGDRPMEVLQQMLSAGAGKAAYSMGTWDLYAGAYVAPADSLDVSDLRGPIEGQADLERRDLFNAVRGTFVDPDKDWQPTSFPAVTNAAYEAEDAGEQIFKDIELPFTTNAIRAQRLAKIELERSRQALTVSWPGKPTCFRLNFFETVNVTVADLGWSPKVMRVLDWRWQPGGGVDLVLQEESAAIYDWNFGNATVPDAAPNTTLPASGPLAPPGAPEISEAIVETSDSRGVAVQVTMACAPSQDAFVIQYQHEYKLVGDAQWTQLPIQQSPTAVIFDITAGTYDFRAAALNSFGQLSVYAQTRYEVIALSVAPAAPTGLSIQAGGGTARLKLDQHPELDVRRGGRILVRFCHEGVTPAWESAFSIGEPEGWPGDSTQIDLPLKPGTYLVKARDAMGTESESWAEIETKQASVLAFSTLATITEDSTFPGTHSGTAAVDGTLTLGGIGMFDDIPDLDAAIDIDGFGGVSTTGTYAFQTGTDLGNVQNVRVTGRLEGGVNNLLDQVDDRTGNVDDWLDWDGSSFGGSAADAWIECRHTDDNPSGSPVWTDWKRLDAAEFAARGFQYRAILTSVDAAYRPEVSVLRVSVEQAA